MIWDYRHEFKETPTPGLRAMDPKEVSRIGHNPVDISTLFANGATPPSYLESQLTD